MPVTDSERARLDTRVDDRDALSDDWDDDWSDDSLHDVLIARRRAASFGVRPDDPTFADTVRDFVRRYGWRAYALPVLALITVVALLTAGSPPARHAATAHIRTGAQDRPTTSAGPAEIPLKSDTPGPNSIDTVLKAGALPAGPAYALTGKGTYRILPGTSKVVGTGTLHRYSVEVENGITGIDLKQFADTVQSVLSDPRSWAGHDGVALQRVDTGRIDIHVTLVSSMTTRKLCGYDIALETSCFLAAGHDSPVNRVVINDSRWVRGAAAYVGDLAAYRIYLINHEDGHALGHEHAHECLSGGLAPAMMQQTIGLRSAATGQLCAANPWPYPAGVSDAPGAEQPDTPQNSEFDLRND